MLGSMYKISTKVLAGRERKVLGKVVDQYQNAFLEDAKILDGSLIANELTDSKLLQGRGGMIFNVDVIKA